MSLSTSLDSRRGRPRPSSLLFGMELNALTEYIVPSICNIF